MADLSTGEDSWPASSCAAYSFLSLTVTHFIGQLKRKTYAGAGDFRPGSNGSISSLTTRWVPLLPQPVAVPSEPHSCAIPRPDLIPVESHGGSRDFNEM